MTDSSTQIPCLRILGIRVNPMPTSEVLPLVEHWIRMREKCRYIVASGMHGIMEARKDPEFKSILDSASLYLADGFSITWIARRRGFPLKRRVSGADFMWEVLKLSEERGYRSFFYGDTEETLEMLTAKLKVELPNLQIAGTYSPPFRALSPEEDEEEIRLINQSKPDVVWVGLGLPKQERWMFDHRDKLDAPVAVGVGAAFKFLSGRVKRAPTWVGENGFEWLWRLASEPRQIWRRVFLDGPRFTWHVALELTGLKKYH